jgi:hypothetical protein
MILTLLSLFFLAPAPPETAPEPVKGLPPRVIVVSVADKSEPCVIWWVPYTVTQNKIVDVSVDGRTVRKVVPYSFHGHLEVPTRLTDKDITVQRCDGKKIDPSDVSKALPRTSAVLLSADGKDVDPFYLQLARAEGVVVVTSELLSHGKLVTPAEIKRRPPLMIVATVGEDGRAYIERPVIKSEKEKKIVEENVDGKIVKREVEVSVQVEKTVRFFLADKNVNVYRGDGKKVDPKEMPAFITKTCAVLLSADGEEVDPIYLQLAKAGTPVLVVPELRRTERDEK